MSMVKRATAGFAMLEVLLAVIVILVVSAGTYSLFSHGNDQSNLTAVEQELNAIAYSYGQLAGEGLTSGVTDQASLVKALNNSRTLSSSYFNDQVDPPLLKTVFGELVFSSVAPYSFTVDVPLGTMRTSQEILSFYNKVQDSYICAAGCEDSGSGEGNAADTVTLVFDMSS